MRRYLSPALVLLALSAGMPVLYAQNAVDLPQIGEPADAAMSPMQERRLGAQVYAELYARDYAFEDPEIAEYVATLGWKLVSHADTQPTAMTFFVMKDPRVNAFALPGGYIGINAGLLTSVETESELAGVMAHELAHVTQRHIARTIEGTQAANLATWAAVLAAIIAGSADPDVVIAALSIGQATTYQRQVNFTRGHEMEADRLGIRTMAQAGYDPDAMSSFFVRLEQQSRLYGNAVPEFLQTHPVNTTRISEARARAATYQQHRVVDPVEFSLIQARARVFTFERPSQAVEYFSSQIGTDRGTAANRYGLALAYSRLSENDHALQALAPALDTYPRQPNLSLLQAQILLAQGKGDQALAKLTKTLDNYPRYAPAIFAYADALITEGQPELARQVLISHEQALGTRMDTYRLLSEAARAMGNTAEAQYQMANFLLVRGDFGGALASLDAGLRISNLGSQDRARLVARRAEIMESLPKGYRLPATQRQ